MGAPNFNRLRAKSVRFQLGVAEPGGAFSPIGGDYILIENISVSEEGSIDKTRFIGVERAVPDETIEGYGVTGQIHLSEGQYLEIQRRRDAKEFFRNTPLSYQFVFVLNFTSAPSQRFSLGGRTAFRMNEMSFSGNDFATGSFEGFGQVWVQQ